MTSHRAQVGRLRRLAGQALAAFPVAELDPKSIIAPGKSGIWGRKYRRQGL